MLIVSSAASFPLRLSLKLDPRLLSASLLFSSHMFHYLLTLFYLPEQPSRSYVHTLRFVISLSFYPPTHTLSQSHRFLSWHCEVTASVNCDTCPRHLTSSESTIWLFFLPPLPLSGKQQLVNNCSEEGIFNAYEMGFLCLPSESGSAALNPHLV